MPQLLFVAACGFLSLTIFSSVKLSILIVWGAKDRETRYDISFYIVEVGVTISLFLAAIGAKYVMGL